MSEIERALADPEWGDKDTALRSALVVTQRTEGDDPNEPEEFVWQTVDELMPEFGDIHSYTYWHDHSDDENHYGYVFLWGALTD